MNRKILDFYKKYIKNPNKQNCFLIKKIIKDDKGESSILTHELYDIYKQEIKQPNMYKKYGYAQLKSSGSSNFYPQNYIWGPNFSLLKDDIWNFMHRFYKIQDKIWINYGEYKTHPIKNKKIRCEGREYYICPNNIQKKMFKMRNIAWITTPVTMNKLLYEKNENFLSFLKETTSVISLTEVDPSFYDFSILDKWEIPWINQMRSWKEGTSFYTCPYKTTHWTENLFHCTDDNKIIDLFNFVNNWWKQKENNQDNIHVVDNKFKKCKCGTFYRQINFQPHAIKWFYDQNRKQIKYNKNVLSSRLLENVYPYFQIIQKSDLSTFEIHVKNKNISSNDIKYITTFISKYFNSFDIKVVDGLYEVGQTKKHPVFWSEYKQITHKTKKFNII